MNVSAFAAGFVQFLAFSQDAADNRGVPCTRQASDAGLGLGRGSYIRHYDVADNAENVIIPDCGHWITEEQLAATTKLSSISCIPVVR
jgi:hypothetical protein